MTATYQSNIKKIKKHTDAPNPDFLNYDLRAYPFNTQKLVHDSLLHAFDPWKNYYVSSLIHVNLYEVTVLEQINRLPLMLVRDGLFTLIDFFNRFPNPKDIPGIMIVHNSLRDFIPAKWRRKVAFYEFEYRKTTEGLFQEKNNQVLIKANVTEGLFDYDQAVKQVLELKKKKYEKYNFFFFNRMNFFLIDQWDNDYRTIDYVLSQSKFINFLEKEKLNYEFHTWKEFFNAQGTHQYDCLDLNFKEKYYIDDYVNYQFARKGATPLNLIHQKITSANTTDIYVPLSHFHGIRVLSQEPSYNSQKADEIFKNLKLMNLENEKCNVGAFQMIDSVSGKKLDSSWFKVYS